MKLDIGSRGNGLGDVNVDIELHRGVNVVADACRLPFADGSFQRVLTQECIIEAEFEGDPEQAIAEIERVLEVNGVLTFNCWVGEPYLQLIPLHKKKRVATYLPLWWTNDGEVSPKTFKSHTFIKEA